MFSGEFTMTDERHDVKLQHHHHEMVPVWFFIGLLLLAYGLIILYAGIKYSSYPATVAMANYHAGIWGGALLTIVGAFYTGKFWPRRRRQSRL
jgi:hypothetical protein